MEKTLPDIKHSVLSSRQFWHWIMILGAHTHDTLRALNFFFFFGSDPLKETIPHRSRNLVIDFKFLKLLKKVAFFIST